MKRLQISLYILALTIVPLFRDSGHTWASETIQEEKSLFFDSNRQRSDKYQEPEFLYRGQTTFLQMFEFQPANLPAVSVLAVERFIQALNVDGITRTHFESGTIPKRVNQKALRTLIEFYGLNQGAKDKASKKMLKEFKLVAKLTRNKNWRGEYGLFYEKSLRPIISKALSMGITPLEIATSKPKKTSALNPETGKMDTWMRWEFKNPVKGRKPLIADMHLPNRDHLMKFGPSQIFKSGLEAARSLPIESAMFYLANNFMAIGTQFIDPFSNPHGIQDILGMYFNKKTIIDFGELFHFYTFILGSRVSTRMMDFGLKRFGTSFATQMRVRPFMNYIGLAAGSLLSSFIADGWLSTKNCYLGYFDNPKNFKNLEKKQEQIANCDLAYERWIRGKMAWQYTGDAVTLMMASAASAVASKAIHGGLKQTVLAGDFVSKKSRNVVLKKVATKVGGIANRVIVSGMKVHRAAAMGATAVPTPKTQIVGWGLRLGHFVMFLFWHKMINALVLKPYKSWDIGGELDESEDRLLEAFQQFRKDDWKIESSTGLDECGNLFQQVSGIKHSATRLIKSKKGLKCYDGTILENLDEFSADNRDWRNMLMEEANMSYSTWAEQTMKVVDKYYATYLFYQDFLRRVRNKSSFIFGDDNPYLGLNGIIVNEDNQQVYIRDDGNTTIEEIRKAQELNIKIQSNSAKIWLEELRSPERKKKFLEKLKSSKSSDSIEKNNFLDRYYNNFIENLEYVEAELSSKDSMRVRQAINQIWKMDKFYGDECAIQLENELQKISKTVSKESEIDRQDIQEIKVPPICYFSELRRRFGNYKPGEESYSKFYLEEASAQIAAQGIDVSLFPKKLDHMETSNVATYLLASMACSKVDLNSRQSWLKRIFPGVTADTSERGWRLVWGERPRSAVHKPFGFKMDFTPPRLIEPDDNNPYLCWDQNIHGLTGDYIPETIDPNYIHVNYKGKKFRQLTELVSENIYPELLEDYSGQGSGFEDWWATYVGRDFNEVLDVADMGYRKVLLKKFMPAIYGLKKNLEVEGELTNCSYYNDYTDPVLGSNSQILPMDNSNSKSDSGYEYGYKHMYPPRYFSRKEIRACSGHRYKYNPIINSTRLEFEIYLDYLLRPMFLHMFASVSAGTNEEKTKKAAKVFDYNRNLILNSLDMMLRYQVRDNGRVEIGHVAIAESLLLLNMEKLKMKMGFPVDPQMKEYIRKMDAQIDSVNPDIEAFPFKEWEQLRNELQKLLDFDAGSGGAQWSLIEKKFQEVEALPWNYMTEDQVQLASAVFRKMTAVTKELAQYQRMIEDVKFKFE